MFGLSSGRTTVASADVRINVNNAELDSDIRRADRTTSDYFTKLDRDVSRASRGAIAGSGIFRNFGRQIAFASGAFIGAAGLTSVVRAFADEAMDSQKVTADLQQVIKTTGGAAGVTADQVDRLANSMLRKTGIDDEDIKRSAILLLTFRNVRNEAGKNNDVFDQSVRITADLSKRMGIDLSSASVLVGKSLNDPIRGVTALTRVGVTFTNQQRAQIKAMVESGNIIGAQKVILAELRSEVGGAAEAYGKTLAGQMSILRNEVLNLGGSLAEALMPNIETLVRRLTAWLDNTKNQQEIQRDFNNVIRVSGQVIGAVADVIRVVNRLTGGWKDTLELLLALKFVSILTSWTTAIRIMIGTEAAETGLAGASKWTKILNGRLRTLRILTGKPFQFLVAYEIVKKITGSNADLSNDAGGPGDLMPVYRNGKWVDPITGKPVKDQAYWNRQFHQTSPGAKHPAQGQQAYGNVPGSVQGALIANAKSALGNPYQYGGAPSLSKPTDCSGLMVAVFAKEGISLPRRSQEQYDNAPIKDARPLLPGDLVFSEGNPHPGHVGLYIGGGKVLEDPHTGDHVKIVTLSYFGWNGASARWWGGRANAVRARSGGGGTTHPHTPPPVEQPSGLDVARTRVSAAEATPGKQDDVSALRALESQLGAVKIGGFTVSQLIANPDRLRKLNKTQLETAKKFIGEYASTQDQINSLTEKTKKSAKEKTLVPIDIRVAIAQAEATDNAQKELKAYNRELQYLLDEEKKVKKNSERYLELKQEEASVRGKIKDINDRIAPTGQTAADKLDWELAVAEQTSTQVDDLKIYNAQLSSLNREIQKGANQIKAGNGDYQKQADLLRQRTQLQKTIADTMTQIDQNAFSKASSPIGKRIDSQIAGTQSDIGGVGSYGAEDGKVSYSGTRTIVDDNGQIRQVPAVTAQQLKGDLSTLQKQYAKDHATALKWVKTANSLAARLKSKKLRGKDRQKVQADLRRARDWVGFWFGNRMFTGGKMDMSADGELQKELNAIEALGQEISDLADQENNAAEQAQQQAQAGSSGGTADAGPTPDQIYQQHQQDLLTVPTSVALGMAQAAYQNYGQTDQSYMIPFLQQQESYYEAGLRDPNASADTLIQLMQNITGIKDQIKEIIHNQQMALTQLPDNLQLALTEAQYYTPKDMADDIVALQNELSYYLDNLSKATDVQARITLMQNIMGIRDQLDQMIQQQTDANDINTKIHDLLAYRADLVSRYAGNIFSPVFGASRLGDVSMLPDSVQKAVTVIQNFTQQPEDPFTWLRQSQFAAQAVYG